MRSLFCVPKKLLPVIDGILGGLNPVTDNCTLQLLTAVGYAPIPVAHSEHMHIIGLVSVRGAKGKANSSNIR